MKHKKENDSHWFLNKCIQDGCDKNAYYGYVSSNLSSRRDASKQYDIETGKTNHSMIRDKPCRQFVDGSNT